jgi:hypothetical protein
MDAADAPAEVTETAPEAAEELESEAAETEEQGELEAESEETEAEAEAEPGPPKAAWDDSLPQDAFTPEALSKPEGIAAAAKLIEDKRVTLFRKGRELDGRDIRQRQRETKWKQTRSQHLQEVENFRAFAQDVHATIGMARNGNAAQRIDALGRLFGGDGRKVYEELTHGILRDGKPAKKTPEIEALESQVGELKQMLLQRNEHEQQLRAQQERQQLVGAIEHRKQEIAQLASSPGQYPATAHYMSAGQAKAIVDYALELKREHLDTTGLVLDDAATLTRIERELAPSLAGRVASQPTSSGPPQKPSVKAQRSPGQRSVTPSTGAQSGGSTRVLTEEERLEELARDPDFLSSLFG